MSLLDLADRVRRHDGIDAFNEHSRMAMADAAPGRVQLTLTDGSAPIALAFAPAGDTGHAPVELAVDPKSRGCGHATALLKRLLAAGETRFWAHGDLPAAQALAAAHGLTPGRVLRQLARSGPLPSTDVPAGVSIRTFQPPDVDTVVAVNARAFADHPEQGSMDATAFGRLAQADWFDPAGIFMAESATAVIGFHWTKRRGDVGEIYVLGVDPESQNRGVGTALAAHGLRHLADRGVERVTLYVEQDNRAALALYRALGFSEIGRDVLYEV